MQPPDSTTPIPPPQRPSGRVTTFLKVAALPALIGIVIGTGALGRLLPQDPYVRAAEELGAELARIPEFEERFGDLEEGEAFRAGTELGAAAIPRLSASDLDVWLSITRELLSQLDVEQCAAAMRGQGDDADAALDMFRVLDVATFERYLGVLAAGVRLELAGGSDMPPPSAADVESAFAALMRQVDAARLTEIDQLIADPEAGSAAETCAAGRELYDALAAMDPAPRSLLIRFVTEASAP